MNFFTRGVNISQLVASRFAFIWWRWGVVRLRAVRGGIHAQWVPMKRSKVHGIGDIVSFIDRGGA